MSGPRTSGRNHQSDKGRKEGTDASAEPFEASKNTRYSLQVGKIATLAALQSSNFIPSVFLGFTTPAQYGG